jgi:hypothetical protein
MDNGLRTKDLWTNNASEWAGQYRGIFYKDLMETWTDILRIRTLPLWTTRIAHVDIERIRMELSSPMVRMLKQSNLIAHAAALDIDTLELYTLFLPIVNGPDLEMTVQLLLPGLLLLLRQYNSARTFFPWLCCSNTNGYRQTPDARHLQVSRPWNDALRE